MADITMPQLGETVTEGTITRWFKKVGDQVAEDEVLFEVSTDKVDSEVPATTSGLLAEILVPEGETVDVGTKLAVITEGAGGNGDGAGEASTATKEASQREAESPSGDVEPETEGDAARPAKAEAEAATAPDYASPSEPPTSEPAPSAPAAKAEPSGGAEGKRARRPGGAALLSPVVRRLLAENDLDADTIEGSGQGGRVTRADVQAAIDSRSGDGTATKPAPKTAPAPKAAPAAAERAAPRPTAEDEIVPFSNIRRRTAEHMLRSQATSAHVLTSTEVDFSAVDKARLAVKEAFRAEEGFSLTYLPFVARAVIDALAEFPHLNATVGDNQLIVHRRINLGIAVDLSFEGLIVPVVHDADTKRLRPVARAIADLAARARSRELTADDISGGTFTITNPGPFGTLITAPMINQPQVAILATDGVRKRAVVVELPDGTDAIAIRPVGVLALSFDHRAFDGAYASAFLGRCRQILETRAWADEL